ncbi:hypothetical protein ALC56_05654 [Trachymyrmex septentrionalis]|uniref:Uncharacterized protein n=1 Tax=Trachymyrmex septentrionalis TaxID=34720 RepID=A0A195FHN1_9HYME|nr:hypothetical protein ALC56_05654 [Trachymyrmex septentrionalis]
MSESVFFMNVTDFMQLLVNYLLTSHPSSRLDFSLVALANYPSRNSARTRINEMRDRKRDKIRPGRWSTALQRARFISLFNKDLVWNSRL